MKKSKILGIALVAAMAASVAVVNASALSADELKTHSVGICGAFNGWGATPDVVMTDDDGDGIWEGTVEIDNVTEDMITESTEDKGSAGVVSRGFSGVQFKVRLDNEWGTSWGDYEEAYDRTENSQTNCCAKEAVAGQSLTIKVKLDTTSLASDSLPVDDDDAYTLWNVTYTAEVGAAETPAEESSEAPAEESSEAPAEESSETPAEESSEAPAAEESSVAPAEESSTAPAAEESTETSAVPTGDTTSAVALVAVVVASLGAAVVMTKKASSKE
jgi:hypothetical protein